MITEDNLIDTLFQIGFCEMLEYEIVFSCFEEKLEYYKGIKRYFKNNGAMFEITYTTRKIYFSCDDWETKKYYSITLTLDDMKSVFIALNNEYK